MKLYYTPGACSLAVHIVAEEAGIALELEKVDLRHKRTESGADFLAINDKGYVPALVLDDGSLMTEVAALLMYVADRKPEAKLAPAAGSLSHYRALESLCYIAGEVHKNIGGLFTASADAREPLMANAARRLDRVARTLEKQDYLLADGYSVADAYLFVVLGWAPMVKFDLSPWPALKAYSARIAGRPAVQCALRREGLIS